MTKQESHDFRRGSVKQSLVAMKPKPHALACGAITPYTV